MTRKGIRHAVPVWLKEAGSNLKTLAYEIKELKDGRFEYLGMAAQPAFDAVFFSAMAWCLTRGVSVVRRKDLPTSVERHLIEPGALDPGWQNRIRTVWSAWKAEVDWQPGGESSRRSTPPPSGPRQPGSPARSRATRSQPQASRSTLPTKRERAGTPPKRRQCRERRSLRNSGTSTPRMGCRHPADLMPPGRAAR